MRRFALLLFILILNELSVYSLPFSFTEKKLNTPPPRIIRTCCAFGLKLKVFAVPFYSYTEITGYDEIGPHKFLGSGDEHNGNIYTRCGGFLDLGHLRDVADWTAYLYSYINENRYKGNCEIRLGYEGGVKMLNFNIPNYFTNDDIVSLAGRIAYDLSVWHEIATWFGVKSVPLVPERFSSFSVEDCYSNLLGATLSMEAIKSNLPYEKAMTVLLDNKLKELGVLKTRQDTYEATEAVRNIWWTRVKKLPSPYVTMIRYTEVFEQLKPLLVPDFHCMGGPNILKVPELNHKGEKLIDFYTLELHLNMIFPLKRIFPEDKSRLVTQRDFKAMVERVNAEIKEENETVKY